MNTKVQATKLLQQAVKANDTAIRALGDYYRAGAGTATARKAYERYERNRTVFEQATTQLAAIVAAS